MKSTGIAWIPEVGDQWETYKVAHGFSAVGSGTTPDTENQAYYDGDVPWVTTSELRETVITDTTKKVTRRALHEHSALKLFPEGTLLIAMYGATIGRLSPVLGIIAKLEAAAIARLGREARRIALCVERARAHRGRYRKVTPPLSWPLSAR